MHNDKYGRQILSENDLCKLFLNDPQRVIKNGLVDFKVDFDDILELQNIPKLSQYTTETITVEEFDDRCQNNWYMPEEYKNIDIAKYVLDLCKTDYELQRVGEELLLFQDRDMFTLLRYCKYLVDTMRKNNIVWGVGRGSSVSSYVLYLLGVHRINSLHYDLSISEFLK
jgi:DNA polymerase III alpha subunit